MGKDESIASGKNEKIKYRFTASAYADLMESLNWYQSRKLNLGEDFASDLFIELTFILEHPASSPKVMKILRRKVMQKFPYNIYYIYHKKKSLIEVIGVLHKRRNPGIWRKRNK